MKSSEEKALKLKLLGEKDCLSLEESFLLLDEYDGPVSQSIYNDENFRPFFVSDRFASIKAFTSSATTSNFLRICDFSELGELINKFKLGPVEEHLPRKIRDWYFRALNFFEYLSFQYKIILPGESYCFQNEQIIGIHFEFLSQSLKREDLIYAHQNRNRPLSPENSLFSHLLYHPDLVAVTACAPQNLLSLSAVFLKGALSRPFFSRSSFFLADLDRVLAEREFFLDSKIQVSDSFCSIKGEVESDEKREREKLCSALGNEESNDLFDRLQNSWIFVRPRLSARILSVFESSEQKVADYNLSTFSSFLDEFLGRKVSPFLSQEDLDLLRFFELNPNLLKEIIEIRDKSINQHMNQVENKEYLERVCSLLECQGIESELIEELLSQKDRFQRPSEISARIKALLEERSGAIYLKSSELVDEFNQELKKTGLYAEKFARELFKREEVIEKLKDLVAKLRSEKKEDRSFSAETEGTSKGELSKKDLEIKNLVGTIMGLEEKLKALNQKIKYFERALQTKQEEKSEEAVKSDKAQHLKIQQELKNMQISSEKLEKAKKKAEIGLAERKKENVQLKSENTMLKNKMQELERKLAKYEKSVLPATD